MKELIWKIDSRRNAIDLVVRIFSNRYEFVDLEPRVFKARVMIRVLKCVTDFNYCR